MPRPIETLLTLPRVRLADRVPIHETENLIRLYAERVEYQHKLAQRAFEVSRGSAQQFSRDDVDLSTLLQEINTAEYIVTKRSQIALGNMLNGIYGDGFLFKDFEQQIEPLCDISRPLREASKIADDLANRTKEESIDLARALLIELPKHDTGPAAN